jgi:hypothetical protein
MKAILQRDVPMTPLYTLRALVAFDADLCGANPTELRDYRWLSNVHRCGSGETQ